MPNKKPFPLEIHFNDILLVVDKIQSKSSVLVVGEDAERKADTGVVVAVGPYVVKETTIRPGHRIRFRKLAGEEVDWDGEKYLQITANDARFTILHQPQTESDGPALRAI